MLKFKSYAEAEQWMLTKVMSEPDFLLEDSYECLGLGFELPNPADNTNGRSHYAYAEKFYEWMRSGEKTLSNELINMNMAAFKFVDQVGLPLGFSTSYGWKIKRQLPVVKRLIKKDKNTRRAYINILLLEDGLVNEMETHHEYPCTVGLHFLVRENALCLVTQMRSNNLLSVMPYDVYNFTRLLIDLASELGYAVGSYIHMINSAHIYRRDFERLPYGLAVPDIDEND